MIIAFNGRTSDPAANRAGAHSETLGEGLYLTASESAKGYAAERSEGRGGNPIVDEYQLDRLNLLKLENNRLPRELELKWRKYVYELRLKIEGTEPNNWIKLGPLDRVLSSKEVPLGSHVTELQRYGKEL